MSVEVLKSKAEIKAARGELQSRGLSLISSRWQRVAVKARISESIPVGDELKSWDILKTVDFLEANVPKSGGVLDIGAYASELLGILHHLDFTNLVGIDLNPDIAKMPYANFVNYRVSDFMHTPFESETFQAITAVSVIEHGFNGKLLLSEVSRLLRPGGYFVASMDYWPEKVDTTGSMFFGMDWKIFSEQEVRLFLEEAREYGLMPRGQINLGSTDKVIHCANKSYTFAWMALQKLPKP